MGQREGSLPVDIRDEMQQSYLDYAMSVIVGRALPDVRDGLKPVHRRVLYTMREMNLTHSRPHRKAARLVGEVMGKYHPHGDAAIYESVVRMAQGFSLRYPLVDGQGNFGSMDGDPPAAMRYTEVRMAPIAQELLADIDKETVDFVPNYDDSLQEPVVLPARLPNLLVNGSSGIAVGMATNIPPHNLGEVVDALVMLLDDPDRSVDDLMTVVRGPDFPTGAYICGRRGIEEAYRTGRGILRLRARAVTERDQRAGKDRIIITEIPYQALKSRLIEKIADLVRDKKLDTIADIRDESDKSGMRIVLELRRDAVRDAVLAQLYAQTPLQSTFGIIFLALVRNQPRVMNLKELLGLFIDHRREVVYRRTTYELRKARDRAHILEGLRKAIDQIDRVIELIRAAASPEAARAALVQRLALSEAQAQAILDMRLQRLTRLERRKIVDEYKETIKQIERLSSILASEQRINDVIKQELLELKERYGDERRTEIVTEAGEISIEDMIAEEDMIVTVSHTDYIKRNPISLYRIQRRGGKGKIGMETKEEDFVERLFIASTHHYILFFTNRGKVHWLKVYEIPQAGRTAKGKAVVNLLELGRDEGISAMMAVKDFSPEHHLLMATRNGFVKRTPLSAYGHPKKGGIIALALRTGDELISVRDTDGTNDVLIGTHHGQAIRFPETEVRGMGRTAQGVIGIRLEEGDSAVSANIVEPGATVLSVTENGYGKRTAVEDYRRTRRGGKGIINIKTSERNGYVVGIRQVYDDDELMMVTAHGMVIRLAVNQIRVMGRNTQGVRLIDLAEGDRVVSIACLADER